MENGHTLQEARAAKTRALQISERLAPVVGVGITRIGDGYGIKVNLRETPVAGARLPNNVDGVPVQVEVVGEIRKR